MRVITIRQPWASLIVHGVKDVENRTWSTSYRGPLIILAGTTIDCDALEHAVPLSSRGLPMDTGGIIGMVDLVDCVRDHPSKWYVAGNFAWVLANPHYIGFIRHRGQLGLTVPREEIAWRVLDAATTPEGTAQ